jgi:hypothetical protein
VIQNTAFGQHGDDPDDIPSSDSDSVSVVPGSLPEAGYGPGPREWLTLLGGLCLALIGLGIGTWLRLCS